MTGLLEALRKSACASRRRVAIGVVRVTPEFLAGLEDGAQFADIVAVGADVPGYESVCAESEPAIGEALASLVASGRVDAVVRGQLYYTHYHESMNRQFGFSRDLMCPCLVQDLRENEWFLTPVVQHDDATVAGRCYLATQAARICEKLGVQPVIGVLAADNERGYLESVDESLDSAELIVKELKSRGYKQTRMFPLLIDKAACECNIVVPMDGTLGNFVLRALGYLGGANVVGGFNLTPRFVSIDTSRLYDRFGRAIEAAAAMTNLGGMPIDEYPG